MASQAYLNLPPTSGKVVISTTCGDIDVELWTKEAPIACRNFIQLCLEGYYDNTMFHRIIPKFMVQGGDPTGTGEGGESVYGEPFKDEIHSRLRFVHRGLVAMANGGKDDNNSQFFFTLGACDWLNGKHTIFGKVAGNTIYNMDAMGEYEVDDDDRPLYPPRIVTTEVLLNPFEDVEPRDLKAKKEEGKDKAPKIKLKKNKALLSFGDDGDAPEEEAEEVFTKKKMVSAHDALSDSKLSKEAMALPSRSKEEREADEKKAREEAGINSDDDDDDDDDESDEEDKKKGAERRKEQFITVKSNKLKALERMDEDGGLRDDDKAEAKEKERERRNKEMDKLKREIQGMKKGGRAVKLGEDAPGTNKDVELLSGIEAKRAMFKSKRRSKPQIPNPIYTPNPKPYTTTWG